VSLLLCACGAPAPSAEPRSPERAAPANTPGDPVVEAGLWAHQPQGTDCGPADVCGHFLQLISPGSDPAVLAEKAAGLAKGKCGGRVIAYKDRRNVMGAGIVLATEQEKRACEAAFSRPEDTDFPRPLVWRRAP
jgi:hypothetical protein